MTTRDPNSDLAHRIAALYERAGEPSPSGALPSMQAIATQRAALMRYAREQGVGRLVVLVRDGHLSGRQA